MRQRVIIAMALALQPELLILDEPTTALDVIVQREILQQVRDLQHEFGFAVLFITHDLSLLFEVAHRIAIMYAGEIVEEGPAETLQHEARHPYTVGLIRVVPVAEGPDRAHDGHPGRASGPRVAASRVPLQSALSILHRRRRGALRTADERAPRPARRRSGTPRRLSPRGA